MQFQNQAVPVSERLRTMDNSCINKVNRTDGGRGGGSLRANQGSNNEDSGTGSRGQKKCLEPDCAEREKLETVRGGEVRRKL